jgi:uncharacterized delta-60 repeat protein/uncharacterized repeat protein (TIGR02543 family)
MRNLAKIPSAIRHAIAAVLLPCAALANPGTLDTSFGYGGTSATLVRAGFDHFSAAAVRPDGRVVAVGNFCTGPYVSSLWQYTCPRSAVVMQWTAAGQPDASFGAGGRVVISSLSRAVSVALQPDGKVLVGGNDTSIFGRLALARLTVAGQPDASFGSSGLAYTTVEGVPNAMALQADGRIVVGGSYQRVDSLTRFLAMRFTASGAVDTSFGGDGIGDDTRTGVATAVAIQTDGRVVLAGRYNGGLTDDAAVARLTDSGALDTSFAGSGAQSFGPIAGNDTHVQGIAQQPGGKLVVAGSNGGRFFAARLSTDGTIDASFGASGFYIRAPSAADLVSTPRMAMLADGRILLAASTAPTGEPGRLTLVQVTANGFDDAAFGISGQSIVPAGPPRGFGAPLAVLIHADGKPQVAGFAPGALLPDVLEFDVDLMATARFSAAGILDATFGTSGQVFAQPVANDARIHALAQSGAVLLGFGAVDDGARSRLAIARFDGGGRLLESNDATARGGVTVGEAGDASAALAATPTASGDYIGFAGWQEQSGTTRFLAGVVNAATNYTAQSATHAVGASVDLATAVAWQSGQLVVAGNTFSGAQNDAAVIRVTVPGLALDTTFGASGKCVFSFGSGDSDVAGAAVQTDGKIVVAGSAFNGTNYDFALARLSANGTLDTSFGTGGKVVTPIGGGNDFGRAVAIQSDGKIVVAGTVYSTINESNVAVARYTAAGALDSTFNGGGIRSIPFAAGVDDARALAIKADGRIVVSGSGQNGATKDVIVAQLTSAGALDATFNATGKVTTSFSSGDDEANAVLIQANDAVVVGGSLKSGDSQAMLLARYASGDPPYVSAVNRISQSPASTTPVLFEVLFSEPVTGVDASDFSLTVTGSVTGAAITGVSGSGNEWIVIVARTGGEGTIRLDVLDDDSIVDGGGSPLNGVGTGNTYTAGQAYSVHPPITITTSSLPAVTMGAAYSQPIAVSGGVAPYTLSVLSGTLPPGLFIESNGTITGAATQAGTFAFTLQAGDSGGSADTQALSITVNPIMRNLDINKVGEGTVVSVPAGIDCGATCSAQFERGTSISLGAVAATGYVFTGWSGGDCTGTGTCVVALNASTTVTATFAPVNFNLSVSLSGAGLGAKVLSAPAGIDCPGACTVPFPNGQVVTLTPSSTDPRLVFTNWSGACTGSGACQVTMSAERSVTAHFAYLILLPVYNSGGGTIVSSPPGISCGPQEADCEALFLPGTQVTLTATALPGAQVSSLTGAACAGEATCQVTFAAADEDQSASMLVREAIFLLDPAGDSDGDGIPNGVEPGEGRDALAKDNDVFGNARLFAMQMYRDFLSREGDPAGIQGWTDLVAAGTYTRNQVIDAFLSSEEFSGFVSPVVRLYFATFLRVPDYDGLVFNAGLVRAGTLTPVQLADFFAASPEFAATYGSLDDAQFVTLLYGNVLGRAPDPDGLNGWVALLEGGMTRGQVLYGFAESAEYQAAMANEVFVTMMYAGMLRRTPEPTGFSGWVTFLDNATYTREQVINGFFLSTEYRARFLP